MRDLQDAHIAAFMLGRKPGALPTGLTGVIIEPLVDRRIKGKGREPEVEVLVGSVMSVRWRILFCPRRGTSSISCVNSESLTTKR